MGLPLPTKIGGTNPPQTMALPLPLPQSAMTITIATIAKMSELQEVTVWTIIYGTIRRRSGIPPPEWVIRIPLLAFLRAFVRLLRRGNTEGKRALFEDKLFTYFAATQPNLQLFVCILVCYFVHFTFFVRKEIITTVVQKSIINYWNNDKTQTGLYFHFIQHCPPQHTSGQLHSASDSHHLVFKPE